MGGPVAGYGSAMRVRWIGLALALVLVGVSGGYAVGRLGHDEPTTYSSAAPVAAHNPAIPIDPDLPYADDIDYPALQPGLTYKRHLLGDRPFQWEYDAPEGWAATEEARDETRWRPADEPTLGGFSLRVKLTNEHKSPEQMVDQKATALETSFEDVVVLARTDDLLSFTYRDTVGNHKRYNTFRWFTAPGGTEAVFEMSVVGRERDQDGLEDLLDRVAASVRKLPS
jgi:hypothetical protein